ncbi:hypothetical protein M3182_03580 [Mesobacillus maritimus]|uniref:hypothetical protein n=1 Tax=Mesobacillus maritimus TaxID=1643336 RepID=UPI002041B552|nr:hypothetical protein [Mesobacillus maritimus]MCM3584825.1 hypothetical protein [Mesobacillus maritimus]MCM3671240.1 hypothetical protein [Mesobacillus maritimus]
MSKLRIIFNVVIILFILVGCSTRNHEPENKVNTHGEEKGKVNLKMGDEYIKDKEK